MSARRLIRLPVSFVFAAALASAAAAAGASSATYTPATPEPGVDIPKVDVSFGMRPYADNTFYVVGIE
jgi:hypothetical protein